MCTPHDVPDAVDDFLQRERISQAILSALPELEGRVAAADGKPVLTIPHTTGGQIVIAKMLRNHILRWVVAVPGTSEPTIHEPSSLEDYPRLVGEALGLTRSR